MLDLVYQRKGRGKVAKRVARGRERCIYGGRGGRCVRRAGGRIQRGGEGESGAGVGAGQVVSGAGARAGAGAARGCGSGRGEAVGAQRGAENNYGRVTKRRFPTQRRFPSGGIADARRAAPRDTVARPRARRRPAAMVEFVWSAAPARSPAPRPPPPGPRPTPHAPLPENDTKRNPPCVARTVKRGAAGLQVRARLTRPRPSGH